MHSRQTLCEFHRSFEVLLTQYFLGHLLQIRQKDIYVMDLTQYFLGHLLQFRQKGIYVMDFTCSTTSIFVQSKYVDVFLGFFGVRCIGSLLSIHVYKIKKRQNYFKTNTYLLG